MPVKTTTVELGERTYEVHEAGLKRAKAFRHRFYANVQPVLQQAVRALDLDLEGLDDVEQLKNPQGLLAALPALTPQLLPLLESLVVDALDEAIELVFLYAPAVEADREYLDEHGTESQFVAAFLEVVKLAVPLATGQLGGIASGLRGQPISSSSPAPSGAPAVTTGS